MRKLSPDELKAELDILLRDPQRYVDLISEAIRESPDDGGEYFSRHQGWLRLGKVELALADLERAIELRPHQLYLLARGRIRASQGRHREALADYAQAEALAPEQWVDFWGPLNQAESHARLGDEAAALAAMSRMKNDYYPGLDGTPRGYKPEIEAELRRRAAAARHGAP